MDEFELRQNMDAALAEYHEIVPAIGVVQRDVVQVATVDSPVITAYLSDGEARWLRGHGYTVRFFNPDDAVVVPFPQKRAQRNADVQAPYGRHHLAEVHDLNQRRQQR